MSVPQLTMAVNPLTAEWQAVQFVRELWSITKGRNRCWACNGKLKTLFACSVDTIGRRVKVAERLGLIRTEYLPGLRRIIHLLVYPNLPDVSGEYAAPVRTACGDPLLIVSLPKDLNTENTTNTGTTANDTKTTAADSERVVVSHSREEKCPGSPQIEPMPKLPVLGEDASKSATLAPLIIPKVPGSAYDHLNGGTADALIAEVAALADIPTTEAARSVKMNAAQAKNAALAAREVKEKREPIRLFWALYWRKAMPNPPPDPKPSRIATGGAKTTVYRQDHSGALTEKPPCHAIARVLEKRAQENQMRGTVRA